MASWVATVHVYPVFGEKKAWAIVTDCAADAIHVCVDDQPEPVHSQNCIPAIDAGARRAGPKLQDQLVKYFGCRFEDPFEVILVDPVTKREQVLTPSESR